MIGTAILLNVIGGLRVFDLVYVMTRGGPNRSTEVLATYMYEQAFKFSDMGYASAIALVIVVLSHRARPCCASAGGPGSMTERGRA